MSRTIAVVLAALAAASLSLAPPPADAGQGFSALTCDALDPLLDKLHDSHLVVKKPTAEHKARVVEIMMESLDPLRVNMLEEEAEAMEKELLKATNHVARGDCTELDVLLDARRNWMRTMEEFVHETVNKKKFALDESVELFVDPDDRPRPATRAEQKELWRKQIHWDLARHLAAGKDLDEAKRRVEHRYELITRRMEELDLADIYTLFLSANAHAMDPHSSYFSADQLEDFRISMELSLEGIGAVLTQDDGYTVVKEVVAGGAAAREGTLQVDDRIVAVTQGGEDDSIDVIDMALSDVVRLIRGKKGTLVTLSVLREDAAGVVSKEIDIVRDAIDLEEQAAKITYETRSIGGRDVKLAVLDLPGFYGGRGAARQADRDVKRLLEEARKEGAEGLVLDLSQNGGGLLDHAVTISGFFLGTGPVVGVEGVGESRVLSDKDPDVQWDGPLVVLTSRASASASEIVAGALKAHRRAVVVGDASTFGKGSVQNMEGLPPGFGALKVTTALFFSPDGTSNQNVGVPADVVVRSVYDRPEAGEKDLPYALATAETNPMRGGRPNPDGAGHWAPVVGDVVEQLAAASKERLAENESMRKVEELLAKASERKATIKVSELLAVDDDTAEDGSPDASPKDEEAEAEELLSVQRDEAVNVLADLVELQKLDG